METISVFYTISLGINSYKNHTKTNGASVHAEHDAITRLPVRKSRKLKRINILVIKTSKTGKLGNSKPCYNCIMHMLNLAPKYGYKINYVYYSNDNGDIEKIKLSELYSRGDFHYSAYYKFKNKMKTS